MNVKVILPISVILALLGMAEIILQLVQPVFRIVMNVKLILRRSVIFALMDSMVMALNIVVVF